MIGSYTGAGSKDRRGQGDGFLGCEEQASVSVPPLDGCKLAMEGIAGLNLKGGCFSIRPGGLSSGNAVVARLFVMTLILQLDRYLDFFSSIAIRKPSELGPRPLLNHQNQWR